MGVRLRGFILWGALLLLWGTGCRGRPAPPQTDTPSPTPWPTPWPYLSPTPTLAPPTVTFPAGTPAPPTPTPIVYVIQKGDTLSAIAARYGVSVEALLQANPGLDPQALPVGASLIVPQAGQALGLLATPTPYPVPLQGPWCFEIGDATHLCTLQIYNPGSQPLIAPQVLLEVADPSWPEEERVWRTVVTPWLILLPAKTYLPMAVNLPRPLGPQAAVRAMMLTALPSYQEQIPVMPLDVQVEEDDSATGPPWPVKVSVELPDDVTLDEVGVLTAAYDEEGRVIALDYTQAPADEWAQGPVRVWLYPFLFQASKARIAAWAEGFRAVDER